MNFLFEIHDANGQAIDINTLDKQACEFWGQEEREGFFASPLEPFVNKDNLEGNQLHIAKLKHAMQDIASNWYDVIGHAIANQDNFCIGWANVVRSMIASNLGMQFIDMSPGHRNRPVKVSFYEPVQQKAGYLQLPHSVEVMLAATLSYYKPYIALINRWWELGYTPVKVEETSYA